MKDYSLKHYAHLGDAVYEVFIREFVIEHTHTQKQMHNLTTSYVNAHYQANLLEELADANFWNEEEEELIRRARNLPTTINKKSNQKVHRAATAFEVVVGYLHVQNPDRLQELYKEIFSKILQYEK